MTTSTGLRVLVTAGAGGIGRAITEAFVAAGASVHICDIDEAALQQMQAQLPGLTTSVCDIADRASASRMVADAASALGGLDVLINNAGIAGPTASVADMDPDAWEAVLRLNLTGTFTVTQHAIPYLKQSRAGVILIMSSLAGRFGYPNRSPYATTKWGLIGFTKTLSRELGEFGIRVNAILPGAVEGPRIQQVLAGRASANGRTVAQEEAAALANQSIKHFVNPAELGALAVFLASDAGRSISGQLIPVDGDSQSAS
ncbi:SDR family oxidoreductase [Paraburkholderia sp. Ac-20340]|uniref:SDR family oxidoreductase n=1 Tax=Paraburkholderia sp. Ac-20340 TaxID=2703888 RepID=UPI00198271B6|nr:SDR family oxidoreductase [Paraburkholderia sp. Ac-20340]MBN3857854.1 SDR family oxidoreductase [Paraburkholderia sp. Ac-20340]